MSTIVEARARAKLAAMARRARVKTPPGDELGATELGQRVAARQRELRRARGWSLDQLAARSGVSRAALSTVETARTNPTIGLLWKVAAALGVPFAELLEEPRAPATVLRRADMHPLRSADGRVASRSLVPAGASPFVELYELVLAPRARHVAEAHAGGVREIVVVLAGALRVVVGDHTYELATGDSVSFAADRPHAYENPAAAEARCHDVVLYPR